MGELTVHLFGGAEVYRGDVLLPAFPTRKSLSLFAYLVLSRGRLVHRDTICGQFWGEQSDADARKALRTCLWRIRSVIEPDEEDRGTFVQVEGSQIRFAASPGTWVDAWAFEDSLKPPPREPHAFAGGVERFERAAALYRGDFLAGLEDEWCFLHRERLRLAYLTALERIVAHHRSRASWLDVIAWARHVLREDPLREHIHRFLMESHFSMGDRPSALRQYENCVRTLQEELGIEPMEETTRLYHEIQRGRAAEARSVAPAPEAAVRDEVVGLVAEVDGALDALRTLVERLERARSALPPGTAPARPARRRRPARRALGVVTET